MTKKLLLSVPIILIIGVLLIAAVFAAGIAGSEKTAGAVNFPDGHGTPENPYIISDYSDLVTLSQLIAEETDAHYAGAYYRVSVKSITVDATGGETFIPIGSETKPFTGKFDGNGVIISGLTVNSDDDYVGLFGYVGEGAVISEVGLYKADIATDYDYAGGIAGYNAGNISSCFVHGSISGLQRVGGIAGYNAGVIENCYSSGAIVPPPGSVAISYAGGLVGEIAAGGALRYTYTFAEVEAEESSESAGAVAGSSAGEITSCYTVAVANADTELDPIGTGSGNAYSYNGRNIANSPISALFTNIVAANWVRVSGYTAGNGVSFAGPVLSVFYYEVAAGDDRDAILYDVFTFRYFSIGNNASYATWGSAENPYLIGSAAELKTLSALTSGLNGNDTGIGAQSFAGKYFALSDDIGSVGDLSPIGAAGTPFSGYFSGNDHTIEGLNINTGADDTGMFGYLVGATVTNLHIDAAYVFGNAYIGIVAGRAIDSTVSNIVITNSTLSAVSNAGGIVGMTQNGAIRSVYVQAQLTGRDASIPNADVGTVQGSPPQSDGNVWYVGNNVSRAHTYSSMIYVADPASDVDVSFDTVQGSYEFTLNANPAAGAAVEFRTVDETVVLSGETVSLNRLKTAGADYGVTVFYLRFVHSVSIRLTTAGGTGNTNFEMNAYFEAEGNPDRISLYDGQTARFVVSNLLTTNFREFRYISAVGTNNSDTEISLSSASNNNNPVLYGRFVMNETLTEITLTVEHLAMPDNYSSVLNKTYDGKPVEYDEDYLSNLPAAIRSNVRYSTGTAPKNAGTYSVITEIVGNGGNYNGIIFGAMSTLFTISRRGITYDPAADTEHRPVIEWGSNGMINLSIAAADLAKSEPGFKYIDGDDLMVNAVVTFDSAALSTVGEGKSVSYSLSLSGTAAVNYELSSSTVSNVAVGEVTKRVIYITPSSVEKVYDGRAPMLTTYNLSRTIDRIYSASDSITYKVPAIVTDNLAITFTPQADGQEPGDAGIYVLTIEFKDDAGKGKFTWDANIGFADVYDLKIEAIPHSGVLVAGDKGIDYVINRRLLSVDYVLTSDGKEYREGETVSYNATPYKPAVTFVETAENGALTSISVKVYGETAGGNKITGESEVTDAGRYLLRIDYDTADSVYKNYVFEEYEFEILKAVPTADWKDGVKYVYSIDGVHVNLSTDIAVNYPGEQTLKIRYFEQSEEIVADDDGEYTLVLNGAGAFPITVVIEGDENRAGAEIEITVTVVRRPVTVSATAVEAVYGEKPDYEFAVADTYGISLGSPEDIQFGVLGITLTVGTSAGKEFPDVGTYDIILSGDVSAAVNYEITLTETNPDALTVVPKKLYIKWGMNMSAVYGAALNIPYTAVDYDTGNDLSQSPLVGKLVLGTMSDDVFTPAEENEFGRIDTGIYSIGWTREFAEANRNYELFRSEESGGYKYQINKAVFGVKVDSNTKVYGEADPVPVWSFINVFAEEVQTLKKIYTVTVDRVGGEDAYQTVDGNTVSPATYRYTADVVKNSGVTGVNNYEYSSPLSEFGSLSITRRAPNVTVNSDSAIEPNVPLSDSVSINASAFDMNGNQISGVFSWGENIGTIPDFTDSDTVSVTAVFTPDYDNADNLNYSETEFVVNVAVLPVVIDIAWGANKYVYSGKATPDMVYTATAAGENVLLTLTYEGDRVNVGSYTVTASINDNNYRLPENASVEVEIVPATVTVSFGSQSYEIIQGDEFTPTVKYEGFVNGETEEVLTRRAEYDTYTLPGSYSLELSGARADNYTFVYVDSTLTIYRAELTDEDFGATFDGAFPEEVTLTITPSDDLQTGNAQNLFNIVKGAYTSLSDKVLRSVYSLNYAGIDGYVNKGDISVTMPVPEFGSAETLQFIYVTNEGDVVVIDNATYGEDGSVTLTMTDAAYILVSVTDDSGLADYTLYMVIGGVVVVLILVILIGIAIKRRRDRRIIKYEDE